MVTLTIFSDIDQWNKVTQVLGTPPQVFFKQLTPSVSFKNVIVVTPWSKPTVAIVKRWPANTGPNTC